jgi:hypothetical protein
MRVQGYRWHMAGLVGLLALTLGGGCASDGAALEDAGEDGAALVDAGEDGALEDADSSATAEDGGVDAALLARCETFEVRDGGVPVAGDAGGELEDAGVDAEVGDGGTHAWTETCLSWEDDCTVHVGRLGDEVCIRIGDWSPGNIVPYDYEVLVDGPCAVFPEAVFIPVFPDSCEEVHCANGECTGMLEGHCAYDRYYRGTLQDPGECRVQVQEWVGGSRRGRSLEVAFEVLEP